jgi:hypothetical protein
MGLGKWVCHSSRDNDYNHHHNYDNYDNNNNNNDNYDYDYNLNNFYDQHNIDNGASKPANDINKTGPPPPGDGPVSETAVRAAGS